MPCFLLVLAEALAALLAYRYAGAEFVAHSLWEEDGPVFLQAAYADSVAALGTPYAGYLHLYPRLVGTLAVLLPMPCWPYVMFGGWFAGLLILGWTVRRVLQGRCHADAIAVLVTRLCLAQPHSGEAFLTVTSVQWWLAVALALMLVFPQAFGAAAAAGALMLALTGPFSILYLPVSGYQARRPRQYPVAGAVAARAAVQLVCLLTPSPSGAGVGCGVGPLEQRVAHFPVLRRQQYAGRAGVLGRHRDVVAGAVNRLPRAAGVCRAGVSCVPVRPSPAAVVNRVARA